MTDNEYFEAVLTCTGHPEWDIVKKGLANDIYQLQASALDAPSWEEVNRLKGLAQGLAFAMNLREMVLMQIDEQKNASL